MYFSVCVIHLQVVVGFSILMINCLSWYYLCSLISSVGLHCKIFRIIILVCFENIKIFLEAVILKFLHLIQLWICWIQLLVAADVGECISTSFQRHLLCSLILVDFSFVLKFMHLLLLHNYDHLLCMQCILLALGLFKSITSVYHFRSLIHPSKVIILQIFSKITVLD